MYLDFFGLRHRPFSITPDPQFLFLSGGHHEALAHLLYAVEDGGGFVLLTGEIGTGKTSLCRYALTQMPASVDVALIVNPELTKFELLVTLCDEFGVPYARMSESRKDLLDQLNRYLLDANARGRHSIVLIDEAQNLSRDVLEQLRLLTNLETEKRKLLQIVLVGQPELNQVLNRNDLRQLNQRIASRFHLRPLAEAETEAYITHRLAIAGVTRPLFTKEALGDIHQHCSGNPRLINILCNRALMGAYAEVSQWVTSEIASNAAAEVLPQARRPAGPASQAPMNPDTAGSRTSPDSQRPGGQLLRTPEAARYLAISASTMAKMRRRGEGPAFIKVSPRTIAYDIADLESWKTMRKQTNFSALEVAT